MKLLAEDLASAHKKARPAMFRIVALALALTLFAALPACRG